MKLEDVTNETYLRHWLTDQVFECEGRLKLEWIEPALFGSTIGAPDCKIKFGISSIGLELKYLVSNKKGIKWTIRPAQRRYHHMLAFNGGRSALLAFIAAKNELHLVRGDHIPLRDYATNPDSGCAHGLVKMTHLDYMSIDRDRQAMFQLELNLFSDLEDFWSKPK
jgi:hypothetical protein